MQALHRPSADAAVVRAAHHRSPGSKVALVLSAAVAFSALAPSPVLARWFKFNKAFVESHYSGGRAFGSLISSKWNSAANVHSISCGGNDGELHIGALETALTLEAGQTPLSEPADRADPKWGVVAEFPNASEGDGPDRLDQAHQGAISFHGYFRAWNEGHDKGSSAPSNPITSLRFIRPGGSRAAASNSKNEA